MEKKFVIITDSACDMPADYYQAHGIELVKLGFLLNNVLYGGEDGGDMDEKEFYGVVRKGAMPTTYQVNAEAAKAHITPYLEKGRDALVIAFSGALSGTANSFATAAKELSEKYPERKILVIDSLCASMGEGLFLDYAVRKAESGASIEETYDYLESIKQNMCHYFTVDNLFHLKRGGRVSAATAVVGTLLSIKPVLYVDSEGRLISIGKAMGRRKSIKALFEKMQAMQAMEPGDPVFISHGDCIDDANTLADMVRAAYPDHPVTINYIGTVIGSHSGPGTLALFFKGKQR